MARLAVPELRVPDSAHKATIKVHLGLVLVQLTGQHLRVRMTYSVHSSSVTPHITRARLKLPVRLEITASKRLAQAFRLEHPVPFNRRPCMATMRIVGTVQAKARMHAPQARSRLRCRQTSNRDLHFNITQAHLRMARLTRQPPTPHLRMLIAVLPSLTATVNQRLHLALVRAVSIPV